MRHDRKLHYRHFMANNLRSNYWLSLSPSLSLQLYLNWSLVFANFNNLPQNCFIAYNVQYVHRKKCQPHWWFVSNRKSIICNTKIFVNSNLSILLIILRQNRHLGRYIYEWFWFSSINVQKTCSGYCNT